MSKACGLVAYTLQSIGIANVTTPNMNAAHLLAIQINVEVAYGIASIVNNVALTLLTGGCLDVILFYN